jgi:hypothetical protein
MQRIVLLLLTFYSAEAALGNWSLIAGEMKEIQNDDGSATEIPTMSGCAVAKDTNDSYAYIFGGLRHWRTSMNNYLYKMNIETGEVNRISGYTAFDIQPANLPALGIPSEIPPPPRDLAAMWHAPVGTALFVFGGYSNYKSCPGNDFWKFNLSNSQWTWISGDINCSIDGGRLPKYQSGIGVFSSGNHPPARFGPAYWTHRKFNRLYFFGGIGSCQNSVLVQCAYSDLGGDIWAYDLALSQWAWIAGSSLNTANAVSTAPGTTFQNPGRPYDLTFAPEKNGNLWLIGPGSSGSYWLWLFNCSSSLWNTISLINVPGTPSFRRLGNMVQIGSNTLILTKGYNDSSWNGNNDYYVFVDVWSFYIPTLTWKNQSGPLTAGLAYDPLYKNGFALPKVGDEPISETIIPGFFRGSSISSQKSFIIVGGQFFFFVNTIWKFNVCNKNDYFDGHNCISCPYGTRASNPISEALDGCREECIKGSVWNGSHCVNCTAGKFSNTDVSECQSCSIGTFSADSDMNAKCAACALGKITNQTGSTGCIQCNAGFFADPSSPVCTACSIGFFSDSVTGSSACFACSAGKFNSLKNSSSCRECTKGKYSSSNGAFYCADCSVGKYSYDGSTECTKCDVGYFSNSSRSSFCYFCGFNTLTEIGASSKSECICAQGYYGKAYAGDNCSPCILSDNVKCDANSSLPSVVKGFFRDLANPNVIYECVPREACLDTSSDSKVTPCSDGYTGLICGNCVPYEYYKLGSVCVICPSKVSRILIILAIVIIVAFGIYKFAALKKLSNITDIKIALFWLQILAYFPRLSSSWPDELKKVFQFSSFLNFDIDITSPGTF